MDYVKYLVTLEPTTLKMTLKDWLTYPIAPSDIIFNASAIDGSDFHQQHPIGVSVHLVNGFPADPAALDTTAIRDTRDRYLANAVFSIETTMHVGDQRRDCAKALTGKPWLYSRIGTCEDKLNPVSTIDIYRKTEFTISPRGNGVDCHRNYEALLFKSVPIIGNHDESMRYKYRYLPVLFINDWRELTEDMLLTTYDKLLETEYDFARLLRSYWLRHRPDINIDLQTFYWLNHFGVAKHVNAYRIADQIQSAHSTRV